MKALKLIGLYLLVAIAVLVMLAFTAFLLVPGDMM
jgi:hypothetical protein